MLGDIILEQSFEVRTITAFMLKFYLEGYSDIEFLSIYWALMERRVYTLVMFSVESTTVQWTTTSRSCRVPGLIGCIIAVENSTHPVSFSVAAPWQTSWIPVHDRTLGRICNVQGRACNTAAMDLGPDYGPWARLYSEWDRLQDQACPFPLTDTEGSIATVRPTINSLDG